MVDIMVVTGISKKKPVCSKVCFLILLVVQSPMAFSAGWTLSPSVISSLSYIDNIDLSAGSSTPSAYVLQLNPSISLQRDGRRFSANLEYLLQNLFYSYEDHLENEDDYKAYHQLMANAKSELVEKLLFVDASTSYSQQNAFGDNVLSFDNLSPSAERSNVKTVSVSPYLHNRFGVTANTELRYRYSSFSDDINRLNDTDIGEISFLINNGTRFNRFGWTVNAQRKDVDFKEQEDRIFSSAGLRMTYKLFSRVSVQGTAGHEKEEYKEVSSASTQGDYWTAGLLWNPSKRTDLSVEVGRRYFGRTSALNFNHRTKHTIWSVGYTEDITNQSLIQIETQLVQVGVTASSGGTGGDPVYEAYSYPTLATGTILRRSASAGLMIDVKKNSLNFDVSKIKYEYQLSGNEEELYVSDLGWQWNVSSKAKVIFTFYKQLRIFYPSEQETSLQQFKVSLQREMRNNISAYAEYRHADSEADNNLNEYKQNAVELGISMKF